MLLKQTILSTVLYLGAFSLCSGTIDPYGVCTHLSRGEWKFAPEIFQTLQELPCHWIRTDFDWKHVETKPGVWNFAHLDRLCSSAEKNSVNILPILDYEVPWATPAWKNLDVWGNYVRTVAKRYSHLPYWEVWNEPNLATFWKTPDALHYTILLKYTYSLLKQINPEFKILYGGTAGIPYTFLEKSLQAGAGSCFDILSIHPYNWQLPPEFLVYKLRKLKTLMKRYHQEKKPIWITEMSWSTGKEQKILTTLLPEILQKIKLLPEKNDLAVIHDPAHGHFLPDKEQIEKKYLFFRKVRFLSLDRLKDLDPEEFPILLPSVTENFPMHFFADLVDYVRRGGILLLSGGLPFFYDVRITKDGTIETHPAGDHFSKELHIGWETHWIRQEVPAKEKRQKLNPEWSKSQKLPFVPCGRFLTAKHLRGKDRMIPILSAETSQYTAPILALYDLNSDLKGKIIAYTGTEGNEMVSETQQAQMLARLYLLALAEGVERIFWFNLRSSERNAFSRDEHLGLLHADLQPKKAYTAYRTLIKMLPPGSSRPVVTMKNFSYLASWTRPDQERIYAVWSLSEEPPHLEVHGTPKEIINYAGKTIRDSLILPGKGILFIRGAENVSFFEPKIKNKKSMTKKKVRQHKE